MSLHGSEFVDRDRQHRSCHTVDAQRVGIACQEREAVEDTVVARRFKAVKAIGHTPITGAGVVIEVVEARLVAFLEQAANEVDGGVVFLGVFLASHHNLAQDIGRGLEGDGNRGDLASHYHTLRLIA